MKEKEISKVKIMNLTLKNLDINTMIKIIKFPNIKNTQNFIYGLNKIF